MLNEMALRKPDFQDGTRIKLGDGQEWTFRNPRMRLIPKRGEDGVINTALKIAPGQGDAIEKAMTAYWDMVPDGPLGSLGLKFNLAVNLLLANYDLTDEHLESLIYMDADEPENKQLWKSIEALIQGERPKETTSTTSE
jgi:hypothetical protein